ncbi:hypothetical protein AC1031_007936 [Aphanomyces cochlioides]|nr:hypothetical protein AC1031_007936 [Aphanomyces cochlioides]
MFWMTLLPTDAKLTVRFQSMHAFRMWEAKVTQLCPREKTRSRVFLLDFASYLMATIDSGPDKIVEMDLTVDGNGVSHLLVATALPNGEQVNGYVIDLVEKTANLKLTIPSSEIVYWLPQSNMNSRYLCLDATETSPIIMKSGVYEIRGCGHAKSNLVLQIGAKEHARTVSSGAMQYLACAVHIEEVVAIKVRCHKPNFLRSFDLTIEEME